MKLMCSFSTAVKIMVAAFVVGVVFGIIAAGAATSGTDPEKPHAVTAEHNFDF